MELDSLELEMLKQLVPYKTLSPTPLEIICYIKDLNRENEELKKCNKESITFLNQDDIRGILIQQDYNIYNLQQRIDKAIEVLKLCNSKCSKEVIDILKGEDNEK